MALLELSGITRSVWLPDGSPLHILRGVDLQVDAGQRVTIVGRSGTGKSTLLNTIGMLDKPSSGTYFLDGADAVNLSEAKRARLRGQRFGFVFQQFNIFNARTALENVEVPLLYASGMQFWRRKELAARMLERVGLGDRLDSYPTQMSGGEQQRIAIARALVRQPSIILADEPTGALDPNTAELVMNLLEEVVAENNAALITITHDMGVATRADTVYELYDGVLHARTRDEVHASALTAKEVPLAEASLASSVSEGQGAELASVGDFAQQAELSSGVAQSVPAQPVSYSVPEYLTSKEVQ